VGDFSAQLEALRSRLLEIYAETRSQTVADWCEANLVLAGEVNIHGPVRFRDFAYMVPYLEAWRDERLTDLIVMAGSQSSKSAATSYGLAWLIEHEPRDGIWVLSAIPEARSFSENRWQAMVNASPALSALKPADADKFKNLEQAFPNCILNFAGSHSLGGVAQRTKAVVVQDELDKYESLRVIDEADRRSTTAARPKRVKISAPKYTGGPIETWWKKGDRREWHLKCAHCPEYFVPDMVNGEISERFEALRWDPMAKREDGTWDMERVEATAGVLCPHCGRLNTEATRLASVREGREIATAPASALPRHASWRWPLWLTPWPSASWGSIASQMVEALKNWNMQYFDNNVRAIGSKVAGQGVHVSILEARKYTYAGIPAGAWLLTCGVDCQDDRLEVQVLAWGDGFQVWSIEYIVIHGDTSTPQPYEELYEYLFGEKSDRGLPISVVCFDSGGHNTDMVYRFCKQHAGRKVFAVRGRPHPGRPVASRPSRKNKYGVKLYSIGTDTAKFQIHGQFKVAAPGPGRVWLRADYDAEYFKQLAAEEVRNVRVRGYEVKQWVQVYDRNEALDTWVYAYAGLMILGGDRAIAYAKKKMQAGRPEASAAPAAAPDEPAVEASAPAPVPTPPPAKPKALAKPQRVRVGGWSATRF